jgi:hypothetical protein
MSCTWQVVRKPCRKFSRKRFHGSAGNRRATVRLLRLPLKLEGARAWSKIKNMIFGSEME